MNPLQTFRRAKLEQKMASKAQTASKAYKQQIGKQPDGENENKNEDGTRHSRGNANKEGGNPGKG